MSNENGNKKSKVSDFILILVCIALGMIIVFGDTWFGEDHQSKQDDLIKQEPQFKVYFKGYSWYEINVKSMPELVEVKGILLTTHWDPDNEEFEVLKVIGAEPDEISKITKIEITSRFSKKDKSCIGAIYQAYKDADDSGFGSGDDTRVIFVTEKGAYMIQIAADLDKGLVYWNGYESKQLFRILHNRLGGLD